MKSMLIEERAEIELKTDIYKAILPLIIFTTAGIVSVIVFFTITLMRFYNYIPDEFIILSAFINSIIFIISLIAFMTSFYDDFNSIVDYFLKYDLVIEKYIKNIEESEHE